MNDWVMSIKKVEPHTSARHGGAGEGSQLPGVLEGLPRLDEGVTFFFYFPGLDSLSRSS